MDIIEKSTLRKIAGGGESGGDYSGWIPGFAAGGRVRDGLFIDETADVTMP
jgi:hypothetical protein